MDTRDAAGHEIMHADLLETRLPVPLLSVLGTTAFILPMRTCVNTTFVSVYRRDVRVSRGKALFVRRRAVIHCIITGPLTVMLLRAAVMRALVLIARQALCLPFLRARVIGPVAVVSPHCASSIWQVTLPVQRPCP
jgi:hypothetical protein